MDTLFTRYGYNKQDHRTPRSVAYIAMLLLIFVTGLFVQPRVIQADNWLYTVRPGDNLWLISEKYLTKKSYAARLLKINNIKSPAQVQPGTKLRIPIAWLKSQPSSCRLVQAVGEVVIIRAPGDQPDSDSDIVRLYVGDTITTGADGSATLEFADKSRLLIQPNSELVMDTLSSFGDSGMVDTRLRLPVGRVETQVTPKKGPASRYEIKTPAAVAAVRGTDFRIAADEAQSLSRSEVLEGKVAVKGNEGARNIGAGYGTVTKPGQAPIAPKKLLPPPDNAQTTHYFDTLPLHFEWQKVEQAQAYRVQIYYAQDIDTPFHDQLLSDNQLKLEELQDNNYILRIRAIDNLGLEGLNRDHAFIVNARPFAPLLKAPLNNIKLHNSRPELSWAGEQSQQGYRLQIARDKTFKDIIIDQASIQAQRYKPTQELPEAALYWRVAAQESKDLRGPFSQIGQFHIKTLPSAAIIESIRYDDKQLHVKWKALPGQHAYQLQMATDNHFETIVLDMTTESRELWISRPSSNIYYYRTRAFNASGDSSLFSEPVLMHISPLNYNNPKRP